MKEYVLSIPERLVRALSALAGGALREIGEVGLPIRVRRTRLYRSLVDSTLRFLIEQVGGVDSAYAGEGALPKDILIRRAAGNAIDIAGIVAFRASPVWVLAALADVSGAGRDLIAEIAEALKKDGYVDIPNKPGWGVELNEEAFKHMPPAPWRRGTNFHADGSPYFQ